MPSPIDARPPLAAMLVAASLLGLGLAGLAGLAPAAPLRADSPADCHLTAARSAAPARITLGETVSVTLRVTGSCSGATRAESDIILVIDQSGSMAGAPLDAAVAAAGVFLDATDFAYDQVGIVGFSSESRLLAGLTSDRALLDAALGKLVAEGGTDIAAGVDEARHVYKNPGHRPGVTRVIVVMTDGRNSFGGAIAVLAARLAKNEGARVFTIGFGTDVDLVTLGRMASNTSDSFYAPTRADLLALYGAIARRLSAELLFTGLTVTDTLASNMRYADASGMPRPDRSGLTMVWDLSFVPLTGAEIRFGVEPQTAGRWPISDGAIGRGIDPAGQAHTVSFPPAFVEVLAPALPTATPAPGCICRLVRQRVPPAVIADAIANPERFNGWQQPLDPGKPPGPGNPPRACLSLQNPTVDYHPQFNSPIWRVGCQ
jgi:Mg-chelatase subunit ChlD